jgi:hypothetical protein
MSSALGILVVYAMIVTKKAEIFYIVRAILLLCIVSSMIYGTSVVLTSISNSLRMGTIIGYIFLVCVEWLISFSYQKKRLHKTLENEPEHALDTKSGVLDLQKDFVISSKGSDKSKGEKILRIGMILLYFAPAAGALMSRTLSDDQRTVFYAIVLSSFGIMFTQFSGLHAGTARVIKEIEVKMNKKITIKTLE